MNFLEFQSFGWNPATISFIGAVFFVILTSQPTFVKGQNIWRQQSGQSVSTLLMVWLLLMYYTGALYGWSLSATYTGKSIALIFGGIIRVPLQAFVLFGLWRYSQDAGKWTWRLVGILMPLVVIIPFLRAGQQGIVYLFFALGGCVPATEQLWLLYKAGNVGPIPLSYPLSYALSTSFWLWYALEFDVLVLKIGIVPMFIVVWATVCVWISIARRTKVKLWDGFWSQKAKM